MPRFVTCGPNEAIVVSGCCHSNPTIRAGGRVFVWPVFHRIQRISLNTMTLVVESAKVYSDGGVPLTLKGIAQVKVQGKDLQALRSVSEMFLDKTEDEIMDIAKATLDGHQRSMIASKKIEDIYKDRQEFSKNVQQSAQADLSEMGLTLISYTVQEISDDEGYLDALGQKKTVDVRCEARKECAHLKHFSELKSLDTDLEKREKEMQDEQIIALKRLEFEINAAQYSKETFEEKAKSEKSGELEGARMDKMIAKEKLEVELMEREKMTDLILKEKELKELELADRIQKEAEYECKRQIALAKAHEEKTKAEALVEADKIRRLAEARAEVITAQTEADAEVLRKQVQAFKEYGNAAKLQMVLSILPRLTAEVAGPIAKCNKITSISHDGSIGFSRVTTGIMDVVEQLCQSLGSLTGQSLLSAIGDDYNDDPDRPGSSKRKSSTESTVVTGTQKGATDRTTRTVSSLYGRL